MTVYLIPAPAAPGTPVPGPADLAGKGGRVLLMGTASDDEQSRWATALGLFAARGGEIEWTRRRPSTRREMITIERLR